MLIAIFWLLFACFSSAEPDFTLPWQRPSIYTNTISTNNYAYSLINWPLFYWNWYSVCVSPQAYHTNSTNFWFFKCNRAIWTSTNMYNDNSCTLLFEFWASNSSNSEILSADMYCYFIDSETANFWFARQNTWSTTQLRLSYTFLNYNSLKNYFNSWYILPSDCSSSSMSSNECQSEYNLIPIDEIDSAYCESNNLCSSSSDPIDCPNVWVSNVFINDLFHPWAFNIVMNIPQEIDRDYAYTNSWNNMNIDIVGYNVDYEKMQEVIDTQNYKPNSDDLSTIVSQIVPLFVPWLCIILLLYFIFRFIKKIF